MAGYRSFLFPEAEVAERSIVLEKRESHHLIKVFRARAGDSVEVLDGKGRRYLGRIQMADARATVVAIDQIEVVDPPKHRVTLLQALPKGKAMDLILRMASEIGVSAVQPIYTAQSEVNIPAERVTGKADKWRATTIEACKQCGLAWLPEVLPPRSFDDWLIENSVSEGELRIVASLEPGADLLLHALTRTKLPEQIVLAVGPEGDFSREEYSALRSNGFTPVRLGENVLRAETATAYILSVIDQVAATSG